MKYKKLLPSFFKSSSGFTPPLKRNKMPNFISKTCLRFKSSSSRAGFTLIELLVVASITGIISTFMLLNFQRSRVDLNESGGVLMADLRATQNKALASTKYDSGSGSKIRCGYGVHYISLTSYSIYAGPDATSNNCKSLNRNLDGADITVVTKNFGDAKVEFKATFNDIFWEPPHPYTYINNSSTSASINITIGKKGGTCPEDCKTINVSTSGKIE